jgi:putative transposase
VQLGKHVSVAVACRALGVPRATYYRRLSGSQARTQVRKKPARALSEAERQRIIEVLHEDRFVDKAPHEIFPTLLDEGVYLCSPRTMYRILQSLAEVRERRQQRRHPVYTKPELLATGPNQVWSWDITKLRGPGKWSYYYLYVIMDIYSRCVVGWLVAHREDAGLAQRLISVTVARHNIQPGQLTIHADRGAAMTSKPVAFLLGQLGITKTHNRPHTSNDNPYSEAQFKTLKYRPDFPDRFGSYEDAEAFCRAFFRWYNEEHYHTGIGQLTPAMLHYGQADAVIEYRAAVLDKTYRAHPERFVNKRPAPAQAPVAAWINPPSGALKKPEMGP